MYFDTTSDRSTRISGRPSLVAIDPPQRMLLHTQVFRRFFLVVWHAMPLALLSGFAMVFWQYGGMAGLRWNVHAMLGLGVLTPPARARQTALAAAPGL